MPLGTLPVVRRRLLSFAGCSLAAAAAACSLLAPSDESLLPDSRRDASADTGAGGDAANDRDGAGDADAARACAEWQQCGVDEYCAEGRCQPCSDLNSISDPSDLVFGVPEPLTAVNADAGLHLLRYPRSFDGASQLMYTRDYFGGQLWLTGDLGQSKGAPMPSPLDEASGGENGSLKTAWPLPGALSGLNFFFNRSEQGEAGPLRIDLYGASVDKAGSASRVVRLPAPFNAPPGSVRSSYSVAFSRTHAFWTVNNDGSLDVHAFSMKLDGEWIPTDMSLALRADCVLRDFEYAFWAVPDAPLLFFSAKERDASCKVLPGEPFDVFVVKLNEAGLPEGAPVSVSGVSQAGKSDLEPSLSPDACWLYFASERDTPDKLRLFRAHRVQ
jgi:hypothetical protein